MVISREWVDRVMVISLCIMIFTLPFSKSIIEACILVAFISWVLSRILSYNSQTSLISLFNPVSTGLNLSVYLFILASAASAFDSSSVSLSLRGFFSKLLKDVMLFFIVAEAINSKKRLNLILTFMVFSMVLIGIDGIFQFITARDFIRHYYVMGWKEVINMSWWDRKISASFMNRNSFGAWLTIMLPLVLSIVYIVKNQQPKKAIKFTLWILVGILTLCLVLTRSKGAWLGFAFAMMFFVICKKSRIFLITIALILVILPLVAPFIINTHPNLARLLVESTKIRSWDNAVSFAKDFIFSVKKYLVPIMVEKDVIRTYLWREALLIIKDFPVLGCGLNTYSIVAPNYKSILPEAGIYCHNSYLQMAAETGIVGLASFILVIASLFITSLINLKKIKCAFYKNILIGLLAGLFGFLVHSFFDVHFYALQLVNLMWFVMGLIVAVQKIALNEKNKPEECNA